jgi:hypothetical protein
MCCRMKSLNHHQQSPQRNWRPRVKRIRILIPSVLRDPWDECSFEVGTTGTFLVGAQYTLRSSYSVRKIAEPKECTAHTHASNLGTEDYHHYLHHTNDCSSGSSSSSRRVVVVVTFVSRVAATMATASGGWNRFCHSVGLDQRCAICGMDATTTLDSIIFLQTIHNKQWLQSSSSWCFRFRIIGRVDQFHFILWTRLVLLLSKQEQPIFGNGWNASVWFTIPRIHPSMEMCFRSMHDSIRHIYSATICPSVSASSLYDNHSSTCRSRIANGKSSTFRFSRTTQTNATTFSRDSKFTTAANKFWNRVGGTQQSYLFPSNHQSWWSDRPYNHHRRFER